MEIKHEVIEFINICTTGYTLYALDKDGQVWAKFSGNEWSKVANPTREIKTNTP